MYVLVVVPSLLDTACSILSYLPIVPMVLSCTCSNRSLWKRTMEKKMIRINTTAGSEAGTTYFVNSSRFVDVRSIHVLYPVAGRLSVFTDKSAE